MVLKNSRCWIERVTFHLFLHYPPPSIYPANVIIFLVRRTPRRYNLDEYLSRFLDKIYDQAVSLKTDEDRFELQRFRYNLITQ